MRLSEAVMLGIHLVDPHARRIQQCAIGMGLLSTGYRFVGGNEDYYEITRRWPWLMELHMVPPCKCVGLLSSFWPIVHLFDEHVMGDQTWTLEQLCDWIRSVEPNQDSDIVRDNPVPKEVPVELMELK